MKWHLEHQALRYPCTLAMRDLFTGAYCEESRLVMSAINQLPSWVWGKMTPVMQLADTDAVRPFKMFSNDAHHKLRRELRAKADSEGALPIFKQGIDEILRVTDTALRRLAHYLDAERPPHA